MLELADAFTSEEADAHGAYRVLTEALEAISAGRATLALRQAYELRMLHWAGYGLDFARCRQCTDGISQSAYFIVSRGGMVCARCRPMIPDGALKVDAASASALVSLGEAHFADALEAQAPQLPMVRWRSRASSPRCWIDDCDRSRFSIRCYLRTARTKSRSTAGKFVALLIADDLRHHVALRMMLHHARFRSSAARARHPTRQ